MAGKHGPAQVEVVQRKSGLYLVMPGRLPFPLLPVSSTHFYVEGTAGERLVFEVEDGDVRRVRLERDLQRFFSEGHVRVRLR